MTKEEKESIDNLCKKLRYNLDSISIRENFNNTGIKPHFLVDLPIEIAVSHVLKFVEERVDCLFKMTEEKEK